LIVEPDPASASGGPGRRVPVSEHLDDGLGIDAALLKHSEVISRT
jgi:hypothetical protein